MKRGTAAGQETKTRILRAALALVGEGGVARVTNRTVAQAAGVGLGALTYYFDSQAQLLRESLELFIAEETERLQEITQALQGGQLTEEQAAQAAEALLEHEPARRAAKLELYLHASRDPDLRDAALRCFAAYDELARSALHALGVPDADELAPALVAIIDGLQLRRLASGEGADLPIAAALLTLVRGARG